MIGHRFAVEVRKTLGVQAPTRTTRSGRVVAATRATPFAPPRRVTGRLQTSVKEIPTANGLLVRVYAPYGAALELSRRWPGFPHEFMRIVLDRMNLEGRVGVFQ